MKILHVNMSLDSVTGGGTVERTVQLHNALKELGEDSHILSIKCVDTLKTCVHESDVTLLPCLNKRWFIPTPAFALVRKLIKQADVIHIMNHWTVINAWVYLQSRLLRKPYIICPAGALTIYGRSLRMKRLYQRVVGGHILRNANAVIAISAHEIELIKGVGVNAERIHHIPNGVHEGDFSWTDAGLFKDKLKFGARPYILFVGRLSAIKGPDILLKAFSKLKNEMPHHLVFAGPDDGMRECLEQIIKGNGLSNRVHFSGYLGGEVKSSAYHGAELLVIPSRHEAMSIVALEGAICGKPVLLTDQCGFSSLVEAGGGIEVTSTVDGLIKGLRKMTMDNSLLVDMGEKGRAHIMDNYLWSIVTRRFLELADQIRSDSI